MSFEPRLDMQRIAPDAYGAMRKLSDFVAGCGLELLLLELVMVRVSQMNGCGYCVDWHTRRARKQGELERRLYSLNGWRESPFYSERERAALELAEAVTEVASSRVPDPVYRQARAHFSDNELAKLVLAISVINAWNRLALTFRWVPNAEAS